MEYYRNCDQMMCVHEGFVVFSKRNIGQQGSYSLIILFKNNKFI